MVVPIMVGLAFFLGLVLIKADMMVLVGPFLDVNIPAGGLFTGAEEVKTEADAARFGGTVGEAYDRCYHKVSRPYLLHTLGAI